MKTERRRTRLPVGITRKSLKNTSYRRAKEVVMDFYGLTEVQLYKETRKRQIVEARQVAVYFMTLNKKRTLTNIGKVFNKDHSFASYSRNQIENFIKTNRHFNEHISMIAKQLMVKYN